VRRRRYRLAFFGLLPLLALSVCATLAHVYVNSSLFQERLERELRTLFDGDVFSFRLLEVRPDLSVQLHDVSLRHPRTRRTLIHTRLVTARLTGGARDLARRHLALTDVYVSDPWVLLEFDEEGNLSLLDALGVTDEDEDEAPSDVRFDLSDVRVARGQLRIARPGFDLSVHHIDVDGFSLGVADDVTMQAQQVRVGGGGLRVEPAPGEPPVVVDWGAFVVDGFSWQKMAFSVAQVTGTVPGGRVSVKGSLQVEPELAFRVSGHVSGRGDMPVLRQFTGELLEGPMEVRGDFEGPLFEPRGSFRASSERLAVPDLVLTDVQALGRLEDGTFSFEEVVVKALGGTIRLSGSLSPLAETYDVKVTLEGVDDASLLAAAPEALPWAEGRVSGTAALRGEGFDPERLRVRADLDLGLTRRRSDTPVAVPKDVTVRGRVSLRNDRVTLRRVQVQAGPHRVALHGSVAPAAESMELEVDLETGLLAPVLGGLLPPRLGLDGRVAFTGKVSGSFTDPGLAGDLELSGVRALGRFAGERVTTRVRLARGVVSLDGLEARTRLGSVSLDARATLWSGGVDRLLPDPPVEVSRAEVKGVPLAALAPPGLGLEGTVDGEARLWGTVSAPRGEVRLVSGGLDLVGERIERVAVDAELLDRAVELGRLEVVLGGGGRVEAAGRVDWSGELTGQVTADRLPLESLQSLAATELKPRGVLKLSVAASGTLQDPRLQGWVGVRGLSLAGRKLGDAHLALTSRDGELSVRGRKVFDHLEVSARMPLASPRPSVEVRFVDLPVRRFVPELEEAGATAVVTGGARLDLSEDGRPTGELRLDRVALSYAGIRATNRAPGRPVVPWSVRFDGERVVLDRADLVEGTRRVTLRGLFDPEKGLDVAALGEVNLGLLKLAGDALARAEGVGGLDLRVTGPLEAPEVRGRVYLPGPARLALRALPGRELKLASGEVRLEPGRAVIPEEAPFKGRLDDGLFTLTGEAELDRFVPTSARVAVRARQIDWQDVDLGLSVLANADLVLTAGDLHRTEPTLSLGGRVDVMEGEVRTQVSPLDVRQLIDPRVEYQGTGLDPGSPLARLAFTELAVVARDSFWVKSQVQQVGLDLEVSAQLELSGTAGNPVIHGVVEALGGSTVEYSRHELEVVRGVVEFDQDGRPVVDLRAEGDIEPRRPEEVEDDTVDREGAEEDREIRVALVIKGPIDKLEVHFESDAGLSEGDVVVLMGTGMLPEDLFKRLEGGTDGALELVLGPLMSGIERTLKEKVAVLDKLELAPNLADAGVQVRVGAKALEGHLIAEAEATVGSSSTAEVTAKLKVTDQIWVDLKSDTGKAASGEDTPTGSGSGAVRFRVPLD